jgi:putative membrane protein
VIQAGSAIVIGHKPENAMKHWFILALTANALFVAQVVAAPPVPASTPVPPPGVPVPASPQAISAAGDPDAPFYVAATQGGLAEIDGGMLAQQRSKNPQVQAFASMVAKDHTAANAQLGELAAMNHVDLPTAPTPAQAAKKTQLKNLSDDEFDRAYIEWQILAHKEAIDAFRIESESGDDKDARQFAIDTLPILRSHLVKLYALPLPPVQPGVPTTTPGATVR